MAHELPGWEVTILGTDINRRSLARAREGKFEAWSLRSTPEDLKRNCFQNEGKLWSLAPEYKQWVTFQYHNLVEHSFPSPLNNLFCFDLIVCRNVMIYFGPDLRGRSGSSMSAWSRVCLRTRCAMGSRSLELIRRVAALSTNLSRDFPH